MSNLNPNRLNLTYPVADMTLMKNNANATIAKIPVGATLTEEERASGGDITPTQAAVALRKFHPEKDRHARCQVEGS